MSSPLPGFAHDATDADRAAGAAIADANRRALADEPASVDALERVIVEALGDESFVSRLQTLADAGVLSQAEEGGVVVRYANGAEFVVRIARRA